MKPIIWNYGGGKQSVAIAVLVAQGKLPLPERVVMADTSREMPSTFAYLDTHVQPLMQSIGCYVEVISHDWARQDLFYTYPDGRTSSLPSMPVWTRQNTELGQIQNHCSGEWKRDAVASWLRDPERGYGRKNPVIQWIGFSVDEVWRVKPSRAKWREHQYPLIDLRMTRADCVKAILDFGMPEPPKSRCYMCPYQNNAEWREVKETPEWQLAVDLDYEIRSKDKSGSVFLHREGVPLIDADLSDKPLPLLDYAQAECSESCWT